MALAQPRHGCERRKQKSAQHGALHSSRIMVCGACECPPPAPPGVVNSKQGVGMSVVRQSAHHLSSAHLACLLLSCLVYLKLSLLSYLLSAFNVTFNTPT